MLEPAQDLLAVFSGFDAFISNSFVKVLAEKCSDCYSMKKPWDTDVSSHCSFSRQEKVAVGFIQCDTKPKEAEIGITLMLETNFGGTLESGCFLWPKNSSFLTEYDTKSLYLPNRIWQKIDQNLTGPVDREYFMTPFLCQCTVKAAAVFSFKKWELQFNMD